MEPVVIVILVAVVEVIVFGTRAGLARGRNEVKAPAVVGNDEFERYFRVHYNTIEQMRTDDSVFAWYLVLWAVCERILGSKSWRRVYHRPDNLCGELRQRP